MDYQTFIEELQLQGKVFTITRTTAPDDLEKLKGGCSLALTKKAMAGERVLAAASNAVCKGSNAGFGLSDDLPNIPGGFGHFLSYGKGEGFPKGERVKKTPELGEAMLLGQPKGVNKGCDALEFWAYEKAEDPDLVSFLVTPDQLSALIHLYNFEKPDYDNVIMPMSSGCASVVRIPLGELEKGNDARAVVGGVDVFSRVHFDADTFFFTIPAEQFESMLVNADESVLVSPIWKGVRKRIHADG